MFKRSHVLMDGTPGAAGGGEPPVPPTPAATETPPTATPPAPSSLTPTPPPPTDFIPEKFRVLGADGKALDIEASARKMAESYAHLEGRVGSGELPPKTADDYAVTVPEQFKEHWEENDRSKAFKAEALAAGLTQKQFDFVMGKYFATATDLVGGAINNSVEAVRGNLEKAWGDKYGDQFNAAVAAFEAFADPDDKGKFDSIMTDPALAYRILAKIGPELREGGGIPATASTGAEGEGAIKAMLTSEANTNPRHPDHAATRARIDAFYNKKYGTNPVT